MYVLYYLINISFKNNIVFFPTAMAAGITSETWPSTASLMKCENNLNGINLHFFGFDFDGTCTMEDTTRLYYKASEQYRTASREDMKQCDESWKDLTQQYWTGYKKTVASALAQQAVGDLSEYNEKGLRSLLKSVNEFERKITKSVEASGLLKGITRKAIQEKAPLVKMSPACVNVLLQMKMPMHLISVNWSEDLIQAKLGHVKHLHILANNFQFKDDLSTGEIGKSMMNAFDKERAFMELCKCNEPRSGYSIYIGDSITDLLALIRADIGIVMGKSETMKKVSKAFGIKLRPLSEVQQLLDINHCQQNSELKDFKQKHVLYEAISWNEVGFSLLGSRYIPNKYE